MYRVFFSVSLYFYFVRASIPLLSEETVKNNEQHDVFNYLSAVFPPLPIADPWSENTKCREESRVLIQNLRNSTTWAMQMLDASATTPVGALKGRVYQLGDYDECIETVYPVQGRYCLVTVTVTPPRWETRDPYYKFGDPSASVWQKIQHTEDASKISRNVVYWALCVPRSCSHDDVQASLNRYLAALPANSSMGSVGVTVDAALCRGVDETEHFFTLGNVAYCIVLLLIMGLVIGSTICDFTRHKPFEDTSFDQEKGIFGYLLCFSLRKNFLELPEPESRNRSLDCLYGLRFLSICCIILFHRIGNTIGGAVQNFEFVERESAKLYVQLIFQGDLTVDTFFLLSGLLVTHILLRILNKRDVNPLHAIVLRFLRLTPAYLLVIFFICTLMYHMGDGPLWHSIVVEEREACRENWWANILYINNYVNPEKMCMVHSWYLPCDTHLFIIALCTIKVLHKHPRAGCILLGLLTIVSIAIPTVVTYVEAKPPLLYFYREFLSSPRSHDYFQTMYSKTHTRASPYFVGMATGYFLYRMKTYPKNFRWLSTVGTIASFVICFATLAPGYLFYSSDWQYDATQAAIFAGLHHFVWAVGLAILIISVVFSECSILGAVLSWSPMIPLSKLVYSAYLVHMALLIMHLATSRTPVHVNNINLARQYFGDLFFTLVIALVMYLTVEAPIRNIFSLIMPKEKKQHPKTLPPNQTTNLKSETFPDIFTPLSNISTHL